MDWKQFGKDGYFEVGKIDLLYGVHNKLNIKTLIKGSTPNVSQLSGIHPKYITHPSYGPKRKVSMLDLGSVLRFEIKSRPREVLFRKILPNTIT